MTENIPKMPNIPKMREGLLTPVATTIKGGRARGCRSTRTLLQSVPALGLASCNISCSQKWSLVKKVIQINSILYRHVASVHEGTKEVVGVDGYIGHIYEGGWSQNSECLRLRLFEGYIKREGKR